MEQADEGGTKRGPVTHPSPGESGGAVYGLGMLGAAVHFFRSADQPLDYALALPKAFVWPAILVYKLLGSGVASAEAVPSDLSTS